MKNLHGIVSALFATGCLLHAWAGPADKLLDEGWRALQGGVPAAAIGKFHDAVEQAGNPAEKERASLLLARALLESNRADDALDAIREFQSPAADRVRGLAWATRGMWVKALPFLEQVQTGDETFPVEPLNLHLARAEALRSLGRMEEAISFLGSVSKDPVLLLQRAELYMESGDFDACEKDLAQAESLSHGDRKPELYGRYLRGRLLLAKKRFPEAISALEDLSQERLPDLVAGGVAIALADARVGMGNPEAADDVLEEFAAKNSESRFLDRIFARLDEIYQMQDNPPEAALTRWTKDDIAPRRALAQFYLARAELREKKADRALRRLNAFAEDYPSHKLASEAHLLRARILSKDSKWEDALAACEQAMRAALTPESLSQAELEAGLLHFRKGEYILSVNLFRSAGAHSSKLWDLATYNSAIAWLHQGNHEKFMEEYNALAERHPNSDLPASLILEEGLQQARTKSESAVTTLKGFLEKFPDHPRVNEARIALAEIEFFAGRNSGEAEAYIHVVNESPQKDSTLEQAKLLEIFVADSPSNRDASRVIDLAREFLRRYPGSPLRDQVRMKLGQALFREEDYASAQTQFELLAKEYPESPMAESALFLAGQSAVRTLNTESLNRALELFAGVAKRNGALRLAARQQQALIQSRLEHHEEAVVLFDSILSASPEPDVRCAALLGKGDSLFAMGAADPKRYEQAMAVYQDLAKNGEISPECRNQALFKQSQCLSKLGREEASIVPLYDLLEAQLSPGQPAEYFWFYKAGFEAGMKLEKRQDWRSAMGIYQRIASMEGPRAEEARERASKLRLEHFLWEE